MGFALLLATATLAGVAQATPIQPDLKKLLSTPPPQAQPYVPARAGWNGPEMAPPAPDPALAYLMHRPPAWQQLAAVITPDPRTVALLVLAVLALRILRQRHRKKRAEVLAFPREGERRAA